MRELTINIEDSIFSMIKDEAGIINTSIQDYIQKLVKSTVLNLKRESAVEEYDELDDLLKDLPSYQENHAMDQITKDDYEYAIRKMQRKPMKGIEKWL